MPILLVARFRNPDLKAGKSCYQHSSGPHCRYRQRTQIWTLFCSPRALAFCLVVPSNRTSRMNLPKTPSQDSEEVIRSRLRAEGQSCTDVTRKQQQEPKQTAAVNPSNHITKKVEKLSHVALPAYSTSPFSTAAMSSRQNS